MTETQRGRVALITGASRGIGAAIARLFEAAGITVLGISRTGSDQQSGRGAVYRCDLTDTAQLDSTLTRILDEWGAPTLVVNNAGGFLLSPAADTTVAQFRAQLELNLVAPFQIASRLLPAMRAAGGGRHIAIGSIADYRGFSSNAAYASSKFGLRGLHEVLRAEYQGSGVLCTLVSPGPTDTGLWDTLESDNLPDLMPRAKMLRDADVAAAVMFIASRPMTVDLDWLRLGPA